MKKTELKKRILAAEAKVFEAEMDLNEIIDELDENQARISDSDYDAVQSFVDGLESARCDVSSSMNLL